MKYLLPLLLLFISGCASSPRIINPAEVRTFEAPGLRCYELIDRDGAAHFACVRAAPEWRWK